MGNEIATKLLAKKLQQHTRTQTDRKYDLSQYSHARIGLGHTGGHIKCQDWLDFQSGFAQAKDAVVSEFPMAELNDLCQQLHLPAIAVHTQANDPMTFLRRPDLGCVLDATSEQQLASYQIPNDPDLLLVISGGLSPLAIRQQIPSFLPIFSQAIKLQHWTLAPIILNPRGRVALGDELNTFFQAKLVVMLIGERPGISTPDSMGIYITWQAKPGCTNDQRNCISNIHQNGLSQADGVKQCITLLQQALIHQITGVQLKVDAKLT